MTPAAPPPSFSGSLWRHLSEREFKQIGAAFEHKDFRFFLAGSFLSNIGSWMQSIAQAWLVLQLTNSPFYLGLDGFANTLPVAVFAFWGGVVADRVDRRRMLMTTQWLLLALALILAVLIQTKHILVWEVIFSSFCTGLIQAIGWPVYQTVLANIVKREHLSNAIALNSVQFNTARMTGPLLGALGLSLFGSAGCFYANAVSFLAVLWALRRIHIPSNRKNPEEAPAGVLQSMREGFHYMTTQRALFWLLLMMAVTSLLGVPLITLLPVFARDILKIGASGLGILVGAFGAGAVTAGMLVAFLGDFPFKGRFVVTQVFLFVLGMLGFALTRNLLLGVLCLFVDGFAMVGFASVVNTLVQGNVPDHLRGRAMSLFVFSFGGCMPFGNLLAGYLAKTFTTPTALIAQGLALGCFVLYVYVFHPEIRSLS